MRTSSISPLSFLETFSQRFRETKLKSYNSRLFSNLSLITDEYISKLSPVNKNRLTTALENIRAKCTSNNPIAVTTREKIEALQQRYFSPSQDNQRVPSYTRDLAKVGSLSENNRLEQNLEKLNTLLTSLFDLQADQVEDFCLAVQLSKAYFKLALEHQLIDAIPEELQTLELEIQKRPEILEKFETVLPHGLHNRGNDCCFISTIQLLNWALDPSLKALAPNFLGLLLSEYNTLHSGNTIRQLINQLPMANTFSDWDQEDASEILTTILDLFRQENLPIETALAVNTQVRTPQETSQISILSKILNFLTSLLNIILGKFKSNQSQIIKMAKPNQPIQEPPNNHLTQAPQRDLNEVKKHLKELFGQHLEKTYNDFSDIDQSQIELLSPFSQNRVDGANLHLPIAFNNGEISLTNSFKLYSEKELLPDDTYTEINGVNHYHKKEKQHLIEKAPKQLIVTLSRFTYDSDTQQPIKVSTAMTDNLEHITAPQELFADNVSANYELKGFTLHLGSTPRSGHYMSYVKIQDQWFCCNDSEVSALTTEEALIRAKNAYTLVLNKKD